jgi:PAS domain-containing protein
LDTDRNLLFGVVALQADLLDADQFIQACTLWTTRKEVPLADLLVELGWLTADGKPCFEVVMGIHKPDGTLTWISINSQPLIRPNETIPYAVVASFEDITDRKRRTRPFWLNR